MKVLSASNLFDNKLESIEETIKAILKDQEFENITVNKISLKDIENLIKTDSIGTVIYPTNDNLQKSKFRSLNW